MAETGEHRALRARTLGRNRNHPLFLPARSSRYFRHAHGMCCRMGDGWILVGPGEGGGIPILEHPLTGCRQHVEIEAGLWR